MTDTAPSANPAAVNADKTVRFATVHKTTDWLTVIGAVMALIMIVGTALYGQQNANFFNWPAFLIVFGGTFAVTMISFSTEDLHGFVQTVKRTIQRHDVVPRIFAQMLLDISGRARKSGALALTKLGPKLDDYQDVALATQMLADNISIEVIQRTFTQVIDARALEGNTAVNILRRAAEVAPGMGLIGTLLGLVHMLAQLSDPSTIGPAMAIALLTTFYGAVLGNVILAPLAAKAERTLADDLMRLDMVREMAVSIARKENPRTLEIALNTLLPPHQRLHYFDV
ncbi:MAG: MotA/TolQ/ExbB proton channel family protein [Pseudomonadota bacterium]